MASEITLEGVSPYRALLIKLDLVNDGLVMNQDFTWEFSPSREIPDPDLPGTTMIQHSSVTFSFADAKVATFYKLKFAK